MLLKTIFAAILSLVATTVAADAPMRNLYSSAWVIGPVGCIGTDYWFNLENYPNNRGPLPPKIWVVGASTWLQGDGNAMLGHTEPNGDLVGPMTNNQGPIITWFPGGTGFYHRRGIDAFHVHYTCMPGPNPTYIFIQLFYVIDDTP